MDPILLVYIILGVFMLFALSIVVLKIAGKDMFFAFYRFIQSKGADIFVIDPATNHVDQHYKIAKEEHFIINQNIYLTNPYKLEGLSDEMVKEVQEKMNIGLAKIKARIAKLEIKQQHITKQISLLPKKDESLPIAQALSIQFNQLETQIETLKSKLDKKTQNYFRLRRPVYFYIKGDPIPKDFFELYSEMDCIQLENIISRAQTKDPKSLKKLEADISLIKKICIGMIILGAVAAWFAFKSSSGMEQIAQHLSVKLSV